MCNRRKHKNYFLRASVSPWSTFFTTEARRHREFLIDRFYSKNLCSISAKKILLFVVFFLMNIQTTAQVIYLPDDPGKWKSYSLVDHTKGITIPGWNKNAIKNFSANLKNLAEEIKTGDLHPIGVDRKISGGIKGGYPTFANARNSKIYSPVSGYLITNAFRHFKISSGEKKVAAEGPRFMIYINWLGAVYPDVGKLMHAPAIEPWGEELDYDFDEGEGIFYEPQKIDEFQGFSIYDADAIVITKSKEPLWLPVSRERFLKALIKEAEADVQELKERDEQQARDDEKTYQELKSIDPARAEEVKKILEEGAEWNKKQIKDEEAKTRELALTKNWKLLTSIPEERVRLLKEEFASLSPAERTSQAYYKVGMENSETLSGLVPEGTKDANPLVTPNPYFFDSSIPKSDIQLIVIQNYKSFKRRFDEGRASLEVKKQLELIRAIDRNNIAEKFITNK